MKNKDSYKYNKGFTALILVVLISAALLGMVLQNTNAIGIIFDEVRHKQDRFLAVQYATACIDYSILELTHDYFYEVASSSSVSHSTQHCSIVSVGETLGGIPGDGYKTVIVTGTFSGITSTIIAKMLLSDRKITLLSCVTYF